MSDFMSKAGLCVALIALVGGLLMPVVAAPEQPRLIGTFACESAGIGPVRFSPDSRMLAIVTGDGLVLWDVATQQVRRRLKSTATVSLEFSPDGQTLAWAGGLWDLTTGITKVLNANKDPVGVSCIAFCPSGKILGAGGEGGVTLFDIVTGTKSATLSFQGMAFEIAFSPDSKTLAVAGGELTAPGSFGKVLLWDVASRKLRLSLDDYRVPPGPLAFSRDGQTLAVMYMATTVELRDPATGRLRDALTIDSLLDAGLAFSPDGRVLVTAGGLPNEPGLIKGCGEVKFWDVTSRKEILTLRAYEHRISSMALSPDGKLLAVSNGEPSQPMKVYDVSFITGKKPGEPKRK